jgi:hypothetical protein
MHLRPHRLHRDAYGLPAGNTGTGNSSIVDHQKKFLHSRNDLALKTPSIDRPFNEMPVVAFSKMHRWNAPFRCGIERDLGAMQRVACINNCIEFFHVT